MFDPFTAIAGAAGGLFDLFGANKQNKAAAKAADKQMAFQERMSNTAHQREVEDLKAAGLNPILSGTGGSGASVPSGVSPPVQNTMSGMANSARNLGDKLFAKRMQDAQLDNMGEQNNLLKEQVNQLKINNARSGLTNPLYDEGGKAIKSVVDWLKTKGGGDAGSLTTKVLDAVGGSDPVGEITKATIGRPPTLKDVGDILQDVIDAGKAAFNEHHTATSAKKLARNFDASRLVGGESNADNQPGEMTGNSIKRWYKEKR